jgi:hypothetical protein
VLAINGDVAPFYGVELGGTYDETRRMQMGNENVTKSSALRIKAWECSFFLRAKGDKVHLPLVHA